MRNLGIDWKHEFAISDWEAERTYRPERGASFEGWRRFLRKKTRASVLRGALNTGFVGCSRSGRTRSSLRPDSRVRDWQLARVCTEFDERQHAACCDTPEKRMQVAEEARGLWECIEHLPRKERIVVKLYYRGDMTLVEVGRRLGITDGRVCQILSRAHLRLRKKLLARERRSTRPYTTREML